MDILIAGGTGFIGSTSAEALKEHKITILSRGRGDLSWEEIREGLPPFLLHSSPRIGIHLPIPRSRTCIKKFNIWFM